MADKDRVYGVGAAFSRQEIYYLPVEGLLTGEYLCGKIESLAEKTVICALDIKALLKYVKINKSSQVFDTGVGAYLLNPLKSSYTFDDIAKEYLNGVLLPSREDLLGKKTFKKPGKREQKVWKAVPVIWPLLLF